MNTQEKIQRIKAKCIEMISAFPPCESVAGWQSTVAAIESIMLLLPRSEYGWTQSYIRENDHAQELEHLADTIIAAWPEELL